MMLNYRLKFFRICNLLTQLSMYCFFSLAVVQRSNYLLIDFFLEGWQKGHVSSTILKSTAMMRAMIMITLVSSDWLLITCQVLL